jgi:hypothetical protein
MGKKEGEDCIELEQFIVRAKITNEDAWLC